MLLCWRKLHLNWVTTRELVSNIVNSRDGEATGASARDVASAWMTTRELVSNTVDSRDGEATGASARDVASAWVIYVG